MKTTEKAKKEKTLNAKEPLTQEVKGKMLAIITAKFENPELNSVIFSCTHGKKISSTFSGGGDDIILCIFHILSNSRSDLGMQFPRFILELTSKMLLLIS